MLFQHSNNNSIKAALILLVGFFYSAVNAEEALQSQPPRRLGGRLNVVLDTNIQAISGIKTITVVPVQYQGEFVASGRVINIQPLLALRERYQVAQAELNGAKARFKQTGQSLERQQALFQHGIAAKRSLQAHEAQGLTDQALVEASHARAIAITNEARLNWGEELADWVLVDKHGKLKDLLSGQHYLLQITLPVNKQLTSDVETIFVEPNGQRNKAYTATLISRSNQVDNTIQGESFFFQVSRSGLSMGMKVTAWIPESAPSQAGVIVPETSLVWYMNEVYVYIKTAKDRFARRLIKEFITTQDGYFIKNDIKAGEEIVTTGGQMLLSEELRGQIPDED